MTLILTMVNDQHALMLADRRLTSGATISSEESNKLAVFTCINARTVVGFTGLAEYGSFNTHEWILESLIEASKPDHLFEPTLERFRIQAGRRFKSLAVSAVARRVTIVFAGYLYIEEPALGFIAYVSNFQHDLPTPSVRATATFEFQKLMIHESRPHATTEPFCCLRAFGSTDLLRGVPDAPIQAMLKEGRPAAGLRDRCLVVFDKVAAARGVPGRVGKQCGSAIIPRDPAAEPQIEYHTGDNVWEVEWPSQVVSLGADTDGAVMGMRLRADDPSQAPPLAVAKVARNHPCPCGSQKKFKYCHGRVMPKLRP